MAVVVALRGNHGSELFDSSLESMVRISSPLFLYVTWDRSTPFQVLRAVAQHCEFEQPESLKPTHAEFSIGPVRRRPSHRGHTFPFSNSRGTGPLCAGSLPSPLRGDEGHYSPQWAYQTLLFGTHIPLHGSPRRPHLG